MKYLRQLLIILIFSFIGEVLHSLIPIQVPKHLWTCVAVYSTFDWHYSASTGKRSGKVSH